MAFTVENITSGHYLHDLALSPDGSKLVYRVPPLQKTSEHFTAALWYASDTTKTDNAKQLTSGLFNDGAAAWHPNSEAIFFLSDRHKQGGPRQIYKYALDAPGEPSLINDAFKEKKRGVELFRISPDGRYLAFCSADELSDEEEKKEKDKNDARVWGDTKGNARLRLYTLSTGEVRTLVDDKGHVSSCTWSPDSKELLYRLSARSDLEAVDEPASLFTVSIIPSSQPKFITSFEHRPSEDAIWPSPAHPDLYILLAYDPHNVVDAYSVHRHAPDPASPDRFIRQSFYAGETEDGSLLLDLQTKDGEFAVAVATGIDTRVDILTHAGKVCTLFGTDERAAMSALDVKKVGEEYVLACIRSSGPDKEPPNVWVGRSNGKERLTLTTKLSSHHAWVADNKLGAVQPFQWTGEDGVALDGIAWFPHGVDPSDVKKPLPTILHVHGGPYHRDTPNLPVSFLAWQPILAEQGYLVLSPNYRGSSGRGHAFARAAYHSMGTIEWSDVNGMVDAAVQRGFADKDKLAIGGWSQGGFMAAWGVSQTKNKFRCAIMGAGVSDWGALATESDVPDFEAELGGTAPWLGATARLAGDPIRHVEDVETAVLILHGERDARVPVGQGIGFHRGLRRMSKYPERHTLVVYPREGHTFTEKKHAEDVIKRVIGHYETWLK